MFVHGSEIREEALRLVAAGVNDCEIGRRLGIPRSTVRDWRRPTYASTGPRARQTCPRCWQPSVSITATVEDYAELLGLYLGDGHITQMARAQRLRLFLDARYGTIVTDADALLHRVFPDNQVCRLSRHHGRMVVLFLYHRHLACLLPQHAAGKKHLRSVALEPWQSEIVAAAPWRFLRGCIRSDGCVFINRTGPYEYVSYGFTNLSTDILDLFEATCLSIGLRPRRYATAIRLNRREDATRLLEHVGIKS
jgi:Homeodomain-like domain